VRTYGLKTVRKAPNEGKPMNFRSCNTASKKHERGGKSPLGIGGVAHGNATAQINGAEAANGSRRPKIEVRRISAGKSPRRKKECPPSERPSRTIRSRMLREKHVQPAPRNWRKREGERYGWPAGRKEETRSCRSRRQKALRKAESWVGL